MSLLIFFSRNEKFISYNQKYAEEPACRLRLDSVWADRDVTLRWRIRSNLKIQEFLQAPDFFLLSSPHVLLTKAAVVTKQASSGFGHNLVIKYFCFYI